MTAPLARVGDISEQIRGVTFAKPESISEPAPGYLPVLRAGNIQETGLDFGDLVYVPVERVRDKQRVRRNDVVIAASSGSLDVVGKSARSLADFEAGFGAFCKVLRPGSNVDPSYFAHYFKTPEYRRRVSSLAAGANINNLKNEHLDDLLIPLPALDEQHRIAAILDQADALRAKCRQALARFDDLRRSLFPATFQDLPRYQVRPLVELADIASGLTKGRNTKGQDVRAVPYLAVSNVQDGHLQLDTVKEIEATEAEIARFALRRNDLVLTEGGDPDKLGRGTVWQEELPLALHQNHIFRVRIHEQAAVIAPYLSAFLSTVEARAYFLKSAKQTTGIASINMTQLKALPVRVPDLNLQHRYVRELEIVDRQRVQSVATLKAHDELFSSIQQRAFSGRL